MKLSDRVDNLETAYEVLCTFIKQEADKWPGSKMQRRYTAILKDAKKIRKSSY